MNYKNEFELSRLIARQCLGLLTPAEEKQLEEWLKTSESNRKVYRKIREGYSFRAREKTELQTDMDQVCRQIEDKVKFRVLRRRILQTASVAALFLLGAISTFIWVHEGKKLTSSPETVIALNPGCTKAIVTLYTGEQKILTSRETAEDLQRFIQSSGQGQKVSDTAYNKIEIPRGGEYRLTLPDGTRIWLNSESKFEYPQTFNTERRVVRLSGEAYFEVARDTSCPFEILTDDLLKIKVLGTSFNVHSYKESSETAVTLVEGKVSVGHRQEETLLAPNQQAVFDRVQGKLSVRDVPDARTYCSWKNGMFLFEKESLEVIMDALSKWYDVEIVYDRIDPRQLGHFTVNIDRSEDFVPILTMLRQITGVDFRIEGKKVYLFKQP